MSLKNEGDKVIVYDKGDLIFVFNFNPFQSFADYRIGAARLTKYSVILSTDSEKFGGLERVDTRVEHFAQDFKHDGKPYSVLVYVPSRCALVLKAEL